MGLYLIFSGPERQPVTRTVAPRNEAVFEYHDYDDDEAGSDDGKKIDNSYTTMQNEIIGDV